MTIRRLIKHLAGLAFYLTGKHRLRQHCIVLMLHRVLPDETHYLPHRHALCVSVSGFETLLRWLSRHFACVPLEQALQGMADTPHAAAKPTLALSFDDGWRDNAEHAWPLLQRYGIPASIFLSTDFIGTDRHFWWESIGETIWTHGQAAPARALRDALHASARPLPHVLMASSSSHARSLALVGFLESLKTLPAKRLQTLAELCPPSPAPHAMNWDQVRYLEDSGLIRFGPHGASHAILTQLADTALHTELLHSHQTLVKHCRTPLPIYCYPNGNHNARVRRAVNALGYRYGLSTRPGLIDSNVSPSTTQTPDIHRCWHGGYVKIAARTQDTPGPHHERAAYLSAPSGV